MSSKAAASRIREFSEANEEMRNEMCEALKRSLGLQSSSNRDLHARFMKSDMSLLVHSALLGLWRNSGYPRTGWSATGSAPEGERAEAEYIYFPFIVETAMSTKPKIMAIIKRTNNTRETLPHSCPHSASLCAGPPSQSRATKKMPNQLWTLNTLTKAQTALPQSWPCRRSLSCQHQATPKSNDSNDSVCSHLISIPINLVYAL